MSKQKIITAISELKKQGKVNLSLKELLDLSGVNKYEVSLFDTLDSLEAEGLISHISQTPNSWGREIGIKNDMSFTPRAAIVTLR
ncbi:hypothetical protein [Enterovibrio norvegicus]|uniref:hypothetical protein n=1 Tax=Enterovibrio norvegicus TaxID=188144 RepID=UPI0013D68DDB|nr:hypothetical protein [Enterovibrio norvegicus]